MTEQIKSAIHCMRTSQDIEVCEECPIYGEVGTDHCFVDSCRIAENSLKAWSEVLTELEEQLHTGKDSNWKNATINAICIIKQKLTEIE